jgi:phenylacetate-CoA ligase
MQQAYQLAKIWKNQWAIPDSIRAIQNRFLANLYYAASRSPYYQTLFEQHSYRELNVDNLSGLPLLTKTTVKQERQRLVSSIHKQNTLLKEKTGGSTGKPTQMYRTRESMNWSRASKLRTFFANGYSLFGRTAKVSYYPANKKIYHRFGIHRYINVNYDIPIEEQVKRICDTKPEFIEGICSGLEDIAKYSIAHGIKLPSPRRIFTNSESLDDSMRQKIVEGFGCDPIDVYATTEAKWVAWECERHEGYHINSDLVIVEIVDDDGQPCQYGEVGNIVVTDLTNTGMPFIRYAIEDVGVLAGSVCSCGRTFPLIKKIYGKTSEFINLPGGMQKPGAPLFSKELSDFIAIDRYKAVQKKDDSLDIKVTLMPGEDLDTAEVARRITQVCGGLHCNVHIVTNLDKTEGGKFLPFIREK